MAGGKYREWERIPDVDDPYGRTRAARRTDYYGYEVRLLGDGKFRENHHPNGQVLWRIGWSRRPSKETGG